MKRKKIFKCKVFKKNNGFSLVEVLCAVVLLALVATPILQGIFTGLSVNLKSRKMLAASDITSGVMEFATSNVFLDYEYTPKKDDGTELPKVKVAGLESYYWGGDTADLSNLKLNSTAAILYPNGPECVYSDIEFPDAAPTKDDLWRKICISDCKMDGFSFDVEITISKPSTISSDDTYYCYDVTTEVFDASDGKYLCGANTKVANTY